MTNPKPHEFKLIDTLIGLNDDSLRLMQNRCRLPVTAESAQAMFDDATSPHRYQKLVKIGDEFTYKGIPMIVVG